MSKTTQHLKCPNCTKQIDIVFDTEQLKEDYSKGDYILKDRSCWNCGLSYSRLFSPNRPIPKKKGILPVNGGIGGGQLIPFEDDDLIYVIPCEKSAGMGSLTVPVKYERVSYTIHSYREFEKNSFPLTINTMNSKEFIKMLTAKEVIKSITENLLKTK